MRRQAGQTDGTFTLREQEEAYSDVFSTEMIIGFWDESHGRTAI